MIVWKQDETGFVLFEQVKQFYIREVSVYSDNKTDSVYKIVADEIYLGEVEREVEAKRILAKIVGNYKTYQNECNPW